jgi:phosphate transport system permease protein
MSSEGELVEDLKRMIARRKAFDRAFAVVGLLSVVVGLATLGTLMGKLIYDAQPALWVPKGAVAATTGDQKFPDGTPMSGADMAWEVRKLSGEALVDMKRDDQSYRLLVVEQFVNVAKLKALAKDGTLNAVIKSGKLGEAISGNENVQKLLAAGKAADLLALDRFLPKDRVEALKKQGVDNELLNLDKIRAMAAAPGGFATLLNERRLRQNSEVEKDAKTGEAKPSVLQSWIARGEFEGNLRRLLKDDELMSLLRTQNIDGLIAREVAFAKERPREFNRPFFTSLGPSPAFESTGILMAWVGSLFVIFVTMLVALPLGVAAGVYMEEYGRKNWLTNLIEINIANLAGVPSIIYGLMALGFFIYQLNMNRSVGTAGLTLALLVLPIVIMATREAIRAIPQNIREASYACGATKWQTVRYHILPYSSGGIMTGSIIGLSRAIGETAPLITVGASIYLTTLPAETWSGFFGFEWLRSAFTAMPLQMYNLTGRPEKEFHHSAALAGIVLIAMTLSLNGVAIYLRYRLRKAIKW